MIWGFMQALQFEACGLASFGQVLKQANEFKSISPVSGLPIKLKPDDHSEFLLLEKK